MIWGFATILDMIVVTASTGGTVQPYLAGLQQVIITDASTQLHFRLVMNQQGS
jgi:hypothetical protein